MMDDDLSQNKHKELFWCLEAKIALFPHRALCVPEAERMERGSPLALDRIRDLCSYGQELPELPR